MRNKPSLLGLRGPIQSAVLALIAMTGSSSHAFSIDTGNEGWSIRWDNTVKASTKYRLRDADPALSSSFGAGGAPQALNFNDGDQNFQNKGIVSRRLDLLSEFDAVWRRDFGVRVSAAGWYDHDIRGTTDATDPMVSQSPTNRFPEETRRRAGRKAELLDAFVFGGMRFGEDSKVTARLGRHGLQYGESLFFGDNGIARAQGPIDIDKLLASPNAQFKEIIRPVPQISTQVQLGADVSIGGYYQFRWEEDRLPAAGTYFSSANIPWGSYQHELVGLPAQLVPPAGANFVLTPGGDVKPKDSGQYGVQLKWRAGESDFGLYYARYHDKAGQLYGNLNFPGFFATGAATGQWYYRFPEGIRTFGASMTRSIGDFNFAGEASIRQNMPLRSTNMLYGFPIVPPGAPAPVGFVPEPTMAKGKTAHVNLSWLATFGPSFLSQESAFLGELAWNRVLSKDDPNNELDKSRTRDATAIRMVFTPSYRQALPGLDLGVPMGVGYTLRGQSAITQWSAQNTGDMSIGLDGNYLGVWQVGMNYVRFFGRAVPFVDYSTQATLGAPTYSRGNPLADRDYISLTVRRTF